MQVEDHLERLMVDAALRNEAVREHMLKQMVMSTMLTHIWGTDLNNIFRDDEGEPITELMELVRHFLAKRKAFADLLDDHETPLFMTLSQGIPPEYWADWTATLKAIVLSHESDHEAINVLGDMMIRLRGMDLTDNSLADTLGKLRDSSGDFMRNFTTLMDGVE